MDWLAERSRPELKSFANLCLSNNYTLLKTATFRLDVEEQVSFKAATTDMSIRLTLSNLAHTKQHLINLKTFCKSNHVRSEPLQPLNTELGPHETLSRTINFSFDEAYMHQALPLFLSFCLLDQVAYAALSRGEQGPTALEQHFHLLALPITLNKLLQGHPEDPAKFALIGSLQCVGEASARLKSNPTPEAIIALFPGLTELDNPENAERAFGLKVQSLHGSFFVTLVIDRAEAVVRVFAVYQSPIHELYLKTAQFILANL